MLFTKKKPNDGLLIKLEQKQKEIESAVLYIDQLQKGQFNEDGKNALESNPDSLLTKKLLEFKDHLVQVAEVETQRNWTNEGLAQFAILLRDSDSNLGDYYYMVLSKLIKYLKANQGQLFIYNKELNLLDLVASHAFNRKKYLEKTILPGEGLSGAVFLEKETSYILDVPHDFVQITSGLGEANPTCILIVPLKINEDVFGVIEIASFKTIPKYQVEFLEKVSESIAASVSNRQVNEQTKSLLIVSRQQEENMRMQEEQMRQSMEELAATQEEMFRKQQETLLVTQRFELVAQTTTEGIWDMAVPESLEFKDDTYFWWADRFREMLGYKNERDFPNRLDSWSSLLHPDHKQITLNAFAASLMDFSGNTPYDVEYQIKLNNGKYKWFRAIGKTIRDENGKPLRVAGTLIDIQATKDIEKMSNEETAKLTQRFELVAQTTTEGIWDMAVPESLEFKDDTYFWWADRFREMLGYKNETDFPNRLDSWANLLHPDHKQITLNAFSASLMDFSGNTPYDVEYQLKLKNGQYKWFRAVGKTARDKNGKPITVAGTLIDIQMMKDFLNMEKK